MSNRTLPWCTALATAALVFAARATPANAADCGSSFIDVDDDGVCSAGDVPLAPVLKGLSEDYASADIDVRYPIDVYPDTGGVQRIYTPPADGHPVGIVLGSFSVGYEGNFDAFATGGLIVNGTIYTKLNVYFTVKSCRLVKVASGASIRAKGADDTFVRLEARRELCDGDAVPATIPATLQVASRASVQSWADMLLIGDHVQLDAGSQLLGTYPRAGADGYHDIDIHAFHLTIGDNVKITGGLATTTYIDVCDANVTANRLKLKTGSLDWENSDYFRQCTQRDADGNDVDATAYPQRIALTNSRIQLTDPEAYSFIGTNGFADDSGYPCDAITLSHVRFKVTSLYYTMADFFYPAPRIDPTGPCTDPALNIHNSTSPGTREIHPDQPTRPDAYLWRRHGTP